MTTRIAAGIKGIFVLLLALDLGLTGQGTQQKDVLVGTTLSPGFDMGVNTFRGRTDWLVNEVTHFRMSYPAGQTWGVVFVAVWPITPSGRPRPSMDLSMFQTLLIEMRAGEGAQDIEIGVKDAKQPDDGTETKVKVRLSPSWRTYAFPLSAFKGADLKNLYVVTQFVFSGNTAQTVYFRDIRYTTQPAPSVASVVSAASFQPGVAGGGWITIYGAGLAANSRAWTDRDLQGTKLPKALDGVAVSIGDRTLVVAFISPNQINTLAPFDLPEGQAYLSVTNTVGTSVPFAVKVSRTQPALFLFPAESGKYAAAVHPDGVYVGKAGLLGPGAAFRPAKPGDTIWLYGTGFGQTNPPSSAEELFQGAMQLPDQDQLRIRVGNLNAECAFAGAVGPGLYQFNAKIPNVTDGDYPVTVEHRGTTTQRNVHLTIQR